MENGAFHLLGPQKINKTVAMLPFVFVVRCMAAQKYNIGENVALRLVCSLEFHID